MNVFCWRWATVRAASDVDTRLHFGKLVGKARVPLAKQLLHGPAFRGKWALIDGVFRRCNDESVRHHPHESRPIVCLSKRFRNKKWQEIKIKRNLKQLGDFESYQRQSFGRRNGIEWFWLGCVATSFQHTDPADWITNIESHLRERCSIGCCFASSAW